MSTTETDGLAQLLQDLSVAYPSAEPVTELDILSNPLDICRATLAELLSKIVGCDVDDAYKSIQWPNNIFNGDLSVTLPRLSPGRKPNELSSEIVDKFPSDHPIFETPFLEGVHLRIFLKLEVVPRLVIPYILDRPRRYGSGLSKPIRSEDARNRLVVEFSSPNITSEIQGKHLRSTIIGAFISRLYESMNWEVTRINYLGDWGKPIALLYVGWTKFGSQESYDTDPVGHLLEVYHQIEGLFQPEQIASRQARDDAAKEGKDEGEAQAEIESKGLFAERNEAFKKLEEGDQEVRVFWERVRNVMVEDYTRFYDRLGVRFDEYSGESQVSAETMIEVEQMLKDKGISEESAGAWMVDMTKLGARAGHAIARDRSGSSTYLLRDLAAVFERSRKYSFDKMIYVVASDNSVHFSQLIKIVEALDKDLASKLQHVKFSESSKMATALGKGYKPQAILDRCKEAVAALSEVDPEKGGLMGDSEDVMQGLATSALLVQELSTRFSTVHAYDTSTLASFKPGSGPDLQYWHAKIQALLDGHSTNTALSDADFGSLADEDQANLLRTLAQYPEVVKTTYHSFEPSGVVAYLTGVAEQLSDCLSEEDEPKVTPGLAALLEATNIVLGNGLGLLGVVPLFPVLPS